MNAAPDWDVIVVGAGHNGLAAGASLLFPLAKGIAGELERERHGVETIELPITPTR